MIAYKGLKVSALQCSRNHRLFLVSLVIYNILILRRFLIVWQTP